MSDRDLRKALSGGALVAALLAGAPALAVAESCVPVSTDFLLCHEESRWATAEWNQYRDSTALELHPYYIEFMAHWPGGDAGGPLDGALDGLLEELHALDHEVGMAPPEMLLRDGFEAGPLLVERAVQSVDMDDDQPMLMATMIVEAGTARIAVVFSHDEAVSADEVSDDARTFVGLIRPAQEG